MKTTLKIIIPMILAICLSSVGLAEDLDNQVRKISDQLRCPTCQAQSVKDSEAGLSVNMKMKIREMLKEGKTESEILDFFEERYGEWILRSPKMRGFNLLLWGLPAILILIAVLLLWRSMKSRVHQPEVDQLTPLTDAEKQKIEKDLKEI
jgi:cytochrome c-type biogenesis protein CcmH